MALLEGTALTILLAALGIILVAGVITFEVINEKLKNRDFFRAKILKQSETLGIRVVFIELEDDYGNSVDEIKLASVEGVDVINDTCIYKNEL